MSKFICNAAWNALTIWPKGQITPCCLYDYTMRKPLAEYRGTETFRDIQEEMLAGERPAGCQHCWQIEDRGLSSYRAHYGEDKKNRDHLMYLDIRNTNTCNLACRFCGPEFSSTWTKILTGLEIHTFDISDFFGDVDLSHLVEIYFAGGEPMMNPAHWKLLEFLTTNGYSKKIKLRYNTNLSILSYKDHDAIELWKQFRSVDIHGSLEAIGKPLTMIRSGADWDAISANVERIVALRQECRHVTFSVFCTVGILNYWFLDELLDWGASKDIYIELSVLENPDLLSIRALPKSVLHLLDHYPIKDVHLDNNRKRIIDHCRSVAGRDEHLITQTVAHTLMMDRARGENLFDLMPWKDHAKSSVFEQQWPKNI